MFKNDYKPILRYIKTEIIYKDDKEEWYSIKQIDPIFEPKDFLGAFKFQMLGINSCIFKDYSYDIYTQRNSFKIDYIKKEGDTEIEKITCIYTLID